jgi:hypothetical protein
MLCAKPFRPRALVDLFAEAPLGADAEAVPDDEHPDHQLGINREVYSAAKILCERLGDPSPPGRV